MIFTAGTPPALARTGQNGSFIATFAGPPIVGKWDIQAHFAEHYPYFPSDSVLRTYSTYK
jgi:hypothetical protein